MKTYNFEGKEYAIVSRKEPCGKGCEETECSACLWNAANTKAREAYNNDLTLIEKPFGLLDKDTQDRLRKAWNGKYSQESNIQYFYIDRWVNGNLPTQSATCVYRLDPNCKPQDNLEITITKNGKPYEGTISVDTARKIGLVK